MNQNFHNFGYLSTQLLKTKSTAKMLGTFGVVAGIMIPAIFGAALGVNRSLMILIECISSTLIVSGCMMLYYAFLYLIAKKNLTEEEMKQLKARLHEKKEKKPFKERTKGLPKLLLLLVAFFVIAYFAMLFEMNLMTK